MPRLKLPKNSSHCFGPLGPNWSKIPLKALQDDCAYCWLFLVRSVRSVPCALPKYLEIPWQAFPNSVKCKHTRPETERTWVEVDENWDVGNVLSASLLHSACCPKKKMYVYIYAHINYFFLCRDAYIKQLNLYKLIFIPLSDPIRRPRTNDDIITTALQKPSNSSIRHVVVKAFINSQMSN